MGLFGDGWMARQPTSKGIYSTRNEKHTTHRNRGLGDIETMARLRFIRRWMTDLDQDWQAVLVGLCLLCFVLAGGTIPW